jgi:hypothetical protein
MFIDAEDKESVAMFEYLCDTFPASEPYMLELMVWAYKHRHDEYEAIMEKYKDTETMINLDILKHPENKHVSFAVPEDPENKPIADTDENIYLRLLAKKAELNPEFETETVLIN